MTDLITPALIGKLFEVCKAGASFFSGGPIGRALTETAKAMADATHTEKKLGDKLYAWVVTDSFREMIDETVKSGTSLTKTSFVQSLAQTHPDIQNAEALVEEFIQRLTVHLMAEDKVFAARWQLQGYNQLFAELAATRQNFSGETRSLSVDEELNVELRGSLNSCKNLLDSEKVMAARQLLQKIRTDESSDKYSKASLARIANLTGVAALRLDEIAEAEREFAAGVILAPNDGFIHSNLAASLIRLGRIDEGLEMSLKARTMLPDDKSVLASHILALSAKEDYDEIANLLFQDVEIKNSARCLLALGQSAIHQNRFEQAEAYLRRGCELDANNAQLHFLLARAIFIPCQRKLFADPPLNGVLESSAPYVDAFKDVVTELTISLTLMSGYDYSLNTIGAYLNRAGVLHILGDNVAALSDLQEVLRIDPANVDSIFNKARILMRMEKLDDASALVESYVFGTSTAVDKLTAEILFRQAKFEEALGYYQKLWNADEDPLNIQLAERWVQLEHRLNGADDANTAIQAVLQRYHNSPDARRIQHQELLRQNRAEAALAVILTARDEATESKRWFSLDVARACILCGNKDLTANDEYKKVCEEFDCDEIWLEYIFCLHNQGMAFAAYKRAEQLRLKRGTPIKGLTEQIEIFYLMNHKQFSDARDLLLLAQNSYSLENHDLVNLASAYVQCGDLQKAADILSQVDLKDNDKALQDFASYLKLRIASSL